MASQDSFQQSVPDLLSTWRDNLTRNTANAFKHMSPKDYIRLVIIVGTYCLIRPWLIKLGAKMQERQHAKDATETEESPNAEMHPNQLRSGKVEIPGIGDSDEEDEEIRPGDWGKGARVRQRKFIRETLAKEEKRLQDEQEAESDKEIEQFLVD